MTDFAHRDHAALLTRIRFALETPNDLEPAARAALIQDIAIAEDRFAATPLPWPIELHGGVIENRNGVNIYAAPDAETLASEIAAYCRCWWAETGDDRDPTHLADEEVIKAYFDDHACESYIVDQIRVAPSATLAVAPRDRLEQGRYCVISTVHLTAQTAARLDDWASWPPTDRPIDIAASVYGWFVPTRPIDDDRQPHLPDDILRVIAFGRERGFAFVLLDCDGGDVDGLPVQNW
ncbi:hypothetical protein GCM10009087_19050 [Sphingomonas oligophenolica]|uniref:DUF5983 domain-containing protein n=1 Tax=Sphingomonas oligophenolica TaxID=301154 RepID=A0ABU9Y352_9SPHN